MVVQQCLVLIKPDGIIKSLTGNIISVLSEAKLKIVGAKIVRVSKELAEKHYNKLKQEQIAKHGVKKGTEIFESVLKYLQGEYHTDRVFALVYQGDDAVIKIKQLAGSTNPEDAEPITIRGKFGRINSKTNVYENVIHVSAPEDAEREIKLWFQPAELTESIYKTKEEKAKGKVIVWL